MNLIPSLLAQVPSGQEQRIHERMMIAAGIADALDARGWTPVMLATHLGRPPIEVITWLSGTHDFSPEQLRQLSRVLGALDLSRLPIYPSAFQPLEE